jgi:ribosomal protein L9
MNEKLKAEDKHNRALVEDRHKIADNLNWKTLDFKLRTWANWKVFGGIGEKDVIKAVKSKFKVELTKKHIELPGGHIKKLWESQIFIKLWKDSMAKITANVSAE